MTGNGIRGFVRAGLSLVVVMSAMGSAMAQAVTAETKDQVLKNMETVLQRRAYVPGVDFAQWPGFLEKRRTEIDKSEDVPSFTNAVNGVLRQFGISHIRLMTPNAARARATGQQEGFGIAIQPVPEGLSIVQVAALSPAAKMGLEPGDIIVEVEGTPRPTALTQIVGGNERDTTLLTVKRKSTGATRHYLLTKKAYSTDRRPTLAWAKPDVAIITLASFTRGYDRALLEGFIAEANQKKAKAVIVDLRNNGGGLVSNCNHLISLFSPAQTPAGSFVNRQLAERYASSTGGDAKDVVAVAKWTGSTQKSGKLKIEPYLGKLIVLINGRSASASEISSAVLREKRGAILVGKPTAGAVLSSIFAPIGNGFEFQIPLSDYITPNGMRLEKNPLKPDVDVDSPRAAQAAVASTDAPADPVVAEALKAATGK